MTQLCEPGQPTCDGSRATVCDETGLGYLPQGTDCQPQGERCQRGACVDTPNQCPNTVAMAGAAAAQVPLRADFIVAPASADITLDGSASTDDSRVARVRWTLVGSPRGVQIRETGNPLVATASGLSPYEEYLFQAVAIDNEQEESCQPETVRVHTVGAETLVFHLLWDNELDPDPFDERGSDVDIHLLKARRGTWFDRETDCHWGAPAPEWEPERPRQILDDTNGRGPEIIVLDNPEPCNWYALAVHYFETEGFGSALAHLHIFRQGRLVLATTDHPLADRGAWWEPAIIHWESGRTFAIDRTFPAPRNGSRPVFSEEALASELCGIPGDLDD